MGEDDTFAVHFDRFLSTHAHLRDGRQMGADSELVFFVSTLPFYDKTVQTTVKTTA